MVERDDGINASVSQAQALAAVVLERGAGDLTVSRLDPAPLDREPVVVEAQAGDQVGVFLPAVPRVAAVSGGLGAAGAGRVLEGPPVVVGVAALDLVGRRGSPPREALGERPAPFRPSHLRVPPLIWPRERHGIVT